MREPLSLAEMARVAGVSVDDLETYRAAKLIDLDGDGELDEFDVLRLRILLHYASLGHSLKDMQRAVRDGSSWLLYSGLLWGPVADLVGPEEVAEQTGMDIELVDELLRSTGLGTAVPQEDVKYLEAIKGLIDGGIPVDMVLDVARVYGDTMRRLAQTEVRMIREFVQEPGRSSLLKDREQSKRLDAVQQYVAPILEPMLVTIHRRHLLRASVQEAVADLEAAERGADRETLETTIVFVDLASFTSLAQVHGDEVAAETLDTFDKLVRGLLDEQETRGNLVKQIGDAFMLAFTEPALGVRFCVALDHAAAREPNFPALRSGINHGPVLYRLGDYVGNTVNLAARIAALASANEIMLTETVAHAAVEIGVQVESAGDHDLAGFDNAVALWKVERTVDRQPVRDPVCGMAVEDPVARLRHDGVMYAFCSPECLRRFLEDPDKHAGPSDRSAKPEL